MAIYKKTAFTTIIRYAYTLMIIVRLLQGHFHFGAQELYLTDFLLIIFEMLKVNHYQQLTKVLPTKLTIRPYHLLYLLHL